LWQLCLTAAVAND